MAALPTVRSRKHGSLPTLGPSPWPQCSTLIVCLHAQTILRDDPLLEGHKGHLEYRWQQYRNAKQAIIDAEGSLADFALVRRLVCLPLTQSTPA